MDKTPKNEIPLYVDLDGTFTKADLLFESLIIAIKKDPLVIFRSLIWILKGKANLKYQLSKRADISVGTLPLNSEFHSFLQKEKQNKRSIILATASTEKYAKNIVEESDLFDSYISSDEYVNLKGKKKLAKIQEQTQLFAYAGNDAEDFEIFEHARESYLVNPSNKANKMSAKRSFDGIYDYNSESISKGLKRWLKQIRVQQWIKNSLIFVPLLASGTYTQTHSVILSLLGFFSFSFLASATYVINDLFDLESDRLHPRKRSRPLASGSLSIKSAVFVLLSLFAISFTITFIADSKIYLYTIVAYLIITLTYSFKLKQNYGLDVITLATLYTIRIFAGAAIVDVPVSFWLLSFSMFLFFSLALVKRCAEIKSLESQKKTHTKGRGYWLKDYPAVMSLGTSSALLAVAMFSFYINSDVLTQRYQAPTLLWPIMPALGYWFMRMWVKTNRGEMHDDPIVYSIKDKGSLITIAFMVLMTLLAQIL